eukprot:UN34767
MCTLQPSRKTLIPELLSHGMNIANLCVHQYPNSLKEYSKLVSILRSESKSKKLPCCVNVDLCGPSIIFRHGDKINKKKELKKGTVLKVAFTTKFNDDEKMKSHDLLFIGQNIPKTLRKVKKVKLDGGQVHGELQSTTLEGTELKITKGGFISQYRTVVSTEAEISANILSCLSEDHVKFAVKHADSISVAVRSAVDVERVVQMFLKQGKKMFIIGKIESKISLQNLQEIINACDGICINREELGTVLPVQKVCSFQKYIIHLCNIKAKPVVTFSGVLQSMVTEPDPTRAECTDVANAVFDGTDCILLHEPMAEGAYPMDALDTLNKICISSEVAFDHATHFNKLMTRKRTSEKKKDSDAEKEAIRAEAVASSAVKTSFDLESPLMIILSSSGHSARLISKFRPKAKILCITRTTSVERECLFSHGVHTLISTAKDDQDCLQAGVT